MKRIIRLLSCLLVPVLLCGMLSSCTTEGGGDTPEQPQDEAALTAVRESLVKATETKGFGELTAMELYENGVRTASDEFVQVRDNKKLYYAGDVKRVVNYPDGYILDMPADWVPDYSMSTVRCRYVSDDVTLIATVEEEATRQYGGAQPYIEQVFQYITADEYQTLNRVKKLSEETVSLDDEFQAYVLKMQMLECAASVKSYYTYVVIYNNVNRCVQLMFKAIDDRDFASVYQSFRTIVKKGAAMDTVTYPREDNPSWSDATAAYYHELTERDNITWGVFSGNLTETNTMRLQVPNLEKKLDFTFPLISSYSAMGWDFPLKEAQALTEDGRHLQYTFHYSYWTGEAGMGRKAPILDVYRGMHDADLEKVAEGIVEYGQPMLFRLNNEMNSDWTDWSALNCMLDPEIFTETWIRMYQIFEKAGANANCIWIWNPQADYGIPRGANWADTRTYMPGADYVDMIGVTYYNFGTEDTWASYEYLYDWIDRYYSAYFGDWSWIISEFGCSDTAEPSRKAQWIKEMFDCMGEGKYPNIKAAVWFNRNDYENGEITHRLVLEESKEILDAFKDGLKRTQ